MPLGTPPICSHWRAISGPDEVLQSLVKTGKFTGQKNSDDVVLVINAVVAS